MTCQLTSFYWNKKVPTAHPRANFEADGNPTRAPPNFWGHVAMHAISGLSVHPVLFLVRTLSHAKLYIYTAKLYVLHTSLKLNLPHCLCLWTFLKLSNVLPIPESPKYIVNMNYITFDEPIGLFTNDFMFYFYFLSYFKQLSLVARGKTYTTKSVRACQLINCTDYQFVVAEILVRTLRRWFWASKDIY